MFSVFRSKLNSRLTALKMARRDAAKNKIQSILVIVVIAIPVAIASFAFSYRESIHLTSSEKINLYLGQAQAMIEVGNTPDKNNYQYPNDGLVVYLNKDGSSSVTSVQSDDGLLDPRLKISGYKWLTETKTIQLVKTKSGVSNLPVLEVDAWDSHLDGRFYDWQGKSPANSDEILVNRKALERLGVKVGDDVVLPSLGKKFKLVGLIEDSQADRTLPELFVTPGSLSGGAIPIYSTKFYAVGDKPMPWTQITKLNKFGFGILSKEVLLAPPAPSAVPLYVKGGLPNVESSTLNVVEWLILGPVILLPIIMLTGSAFSFAVRRQVRSLAVMSSLGARKSTLRFITISNGIWLGFLGGLSGAVLGTLLAWFYAPALTNGARVSYPGLHLPVITLLSIVIAGAVIGAIVSAIPARAAAKVDILSAIRGTRRDPKARKRSGVISLLMLSVGSIGLAVTVPAWAYLDDQITKHLMDLAQANKLQLLVIYGALFSSFIAIIGLLIGASWVLIFARFIFKRFGTTANYATNDLVYNRKRFTSVIATVIATSFLASVVLSFFYTMAKPGADRYRPYMEANQIQISTTYNEKHMNTSSQLKDYLANRESELNHQMESAKSIAPIYSATLVNVHRTFGNLGYKYYPSGELILGAEGDVPYINLDYNYLCPYSSASPASKKILKANLNNDWRLVNEIQSMPIYADCQRIASNSPSSFIVATPQELRILLGGRVDEIAEQALKTDKAVVFNKGFLTKGALQLNWYPSGIDPLVYGDKELPDLKYFPAKDASGKLISYGKPSRTENIPAVLSSAANTSLNVVISPTLAKRFGISYYPLGVVVNYKQPITTDQVDALYQALPEGFDYDPGPATDLDHIAWLITFFAGVFILSATLIALTLSYLESRVDQAALWAVGASRSFRSKVLAFQGFSLNLVGGLMGSAVGYSLVLVLTSSLHTVFAVPVAQVLTLTSGLPLLSALLLFVFTPKRYKMRNRLSLD